MKIGQDVECPLRWVTSWLELKGIPDFYACFDPLHPRYETVLNGRECAPTDMQGIIDLFLLGRLVQPSELYGVPPEVIEALERGDILSRHRDGSISLSGLVLLPIMGLWLLCQKAQPNPTLYFGDDSIALAQRLFARPGARALDLCAGPGIQALRLAMLGADVVAIEVNPVAAALAKLNVALNGLESKVDVRIGNLYEPVLGERFDRICANPPLLPIPDDMPYPFVGHGGADGLKIVQKILDGLPHVLNQGGIARILGTTLSDGYLPLCIESLDQWARSSCLQLTMFVTSHHPLIPGSQFFEGLSDTSASTGKITPADARQRFQSSLSRMGATHICAYFLHVTHGSGGAQLLDITEEPTLDLWFAGA